MDSSAAFKASSCCIFKSISWYSAYGFSNNPNSNFTRKTRATAESKADVRTSLFKKGEENNLS